MSDVTQILSQIEAGDSAAAAQLLPLVYVELRKLAAARLAQEKPGQTLQATALVHEAYLKLVGTEAAQQFAGRNHFFAAAAEAMRQILVDAARYKGRQKRGGDLQRLDLEIEGLAFAGPAENVLALHEALDLLEHDHPQKAALVKLRYFAGFTQAEAAAALGVSTSSADRDWRYARAWLAQRLRERETLLTDS